mmetsp:Transcript_60667/g.188395  ORF Transcript_60667/g.188395 Transcript_60667/m.188395 type:complete len:80 (-) Transcript_60667:1094-1333(-)
MPPAAWQVTAAAWLLAAHPAELGCEAPVAKRCVLQRRRGRFGRRLSLDKRSPGRQRLERRLSVCCVVGFRRWLLRQSRG